MVKVGSGKHVFEVDDYWAKNPAWMHLYPATDVAVDAQDNVFVMTRTEHPVMVFDKDGKYLDWWGDHQFTNPHGISVGPDGNVYCVDNMQHTVKKFTKDGKLLMSLGTPNQNSPRLGGAPFNGVTHVAFARTGNIYISDGYGNARVHVYSPDGKPLFGWGEPGSGPGQFSTPTHHVAIDDMDQVYICDRGNNRIQVFDLQGKYLTEWKCEHRPCATVFGPGGIAYVAELEHTVSIFDRATGKRIGGWSEGGKSTDPGGMMSPHGTCIDSRGVVYVAEVAAGNVDRGGRACQKFTPA